MPTRQPGCPTRGATPAATSTCFPTYVWWVVVRQTPLVCVLHVDRMLDLSAVAALVGVTRKSHQSLRLAHRSELVPLFGFPAGGLGPWGLRSRETRVVMDEELLQLDGGGVLVGAGVVDVHLAVPPQCIVDACGATVGQIHESLGPE